MSDPQRPQTGATAVRPLDEGCRLSVILPLYRARSWIESCIGFHAAQHQREGVEWIAVESSGDGAADWIERHQPWVRVVRSDRRMLCSEARNRGVEVARGRWFAFADHDVQVPPDWTANILRRLGEGHEVFGGPIVNGTPDSRVGTADYFCSFNESLPGRRLDLRCRRLPGANLVVSRRAWQQGGPQDEALEFGEDTVQAWKLHRAGWSVGFFPEVRVVHVNRTEPLAFLEHQRSYGRGSARTRLRYSIHGSWLVRRPGLSALLPVYRTAAALARIGRADPALFGPWLGCLGWFLRGQRAYAQAFREELIASARAARQALLEGQRTP